jgi:hypothetical protein
VKLGEPRRKLHGVDHFENPSFDAAQAFNEAPGVGNARWERGRDSTHGHFADNAVEFRARFHPVNIFGQWFSSYASGAGERLCQRWRFLTFGDEHFKQVWLRREQFVSYSLDLSGIVLVLKQWARQTADPELRERV